MLDFASSKEGAQIVLSTSSDDDHPPENIIDGLTETFWATTGLYPQEVVIRFKSVINIVGIEITCFYVQRFVVKTSEQDNCDKFEILTERELERNDHHQQREEVKVDREKKAHCLRSGFVVIPAKERRSRSRERRRSRSRSRPRGRRSKSGSRSSRRPSRTPPRAYSTRSRSKSKGKKSRSRSRHRSRSRSRDKDGGRGKDKSKDKSRDKEKGSRGKDTEKSGEKKKGLGSRSPSPPTLDREGSAAPRSADEGSPAKLEASAKVKEAIEKPERQGFGGGGKRQERNKSDHVPAPRKPSSDGAGDKKGSKKR